MHVADVDELEFPLAPHLLGKTTLLPRPHLPVDALNVRTRLQRNIDMAVELAQELEKGLVVGEIELRVDARDHAQREMRIAGRVADDARDPVILRPAVLQDGHGLADNVGAAEPRQSLACGQNDRADRVERSLAIAVHERKADDLEEIAADLNGAFGRVGLASLPHERRVLAHVHDFIDLRKVGLEILQGDIRGVLRPKRVARLRSLDMKLDLIGARRARRVAVERRLVAHIHQDRQARRHTDREPRDGDEGVRLVLSQRPQAHGQIIAPHRPVLLLVIPNAALKPRVLHSMPGIPRDRPNRLGGWTPAPARPR